MEINNARKEAEFSLFFSKFLESLPYKHCLDTFCLEIISLNSPISMKMIA